MFISRKREHQHHHSCAKYDSQSHCTDNRKQKRNKKSSISNDNKQEKQTKKQHQQQQKETNQTSKQPLHKNNNSQTQQQQNKQNNKNPTTHHHHHHHHQQQQQQQKTIKDKPTNEKSNKQARLTAIKPTVTEQQTKHNPLSQSQTCNIATPLKEPDREAGKQAMQESLASQKQKTKNKQTKTTTYFFLVSRNVKALQTIGYKQFRHPFIFLNFDCFKIWQWIMTET